MPSCRETDEKFNTEFKGNSFYSSKFVYRSWGELLHKEQLYEAFCGSRGRRVKSSTFPQEMSFRKATSLRWKQSGGVKGDRSDFSRPLPSSSLLEANTVLAH